MCEEATASKHFQISKFFTIYVLMGVDLCVCKAAFSQPQLTRKLLASGAHENFPCTNPFPLCARKLAQAVNLILSAITQNFVSVGTQDLTWCLFQPPVFPNPLSKLLQALQVYKVSLATAPENCRTEQLGC